MSKAKIRVTKASSSGGKLKLSCTECDITAEYDLPSSIDAINAMSSAFEQSHAACKRKKIHRELGNSNK